MKTIRKILYPSDLSAESEAALPLVATLAQSLGAEVTLLHIIEPVFVGGAFEGAYAAQVEVFDRMREDARRFAEERAPQVLDKQLAADTPRSVALREGYATAEIVAHAQEHDFDLIVMATHGRGGFTRLLLGSVADKVMRQSTVPVCLVPMAEKD